MNHKNLLAALLSVALVAQPALPFARSPVLWNRPTALLPLKADLVIDKAEYSAAIDGGSFFIPAGIKVTVRNKGTATAGPCKLRMEAPSTAPWDISVPSLAAGKSTVVSFSNTNFKVGWTKFTVDYFDVVCELSELNNGFQVYKAG